MKKIYKNLVLVFLLLTCFGAKATIWSVTVGPSTFNPNALPNVIVGDTIRWMHIGGSHTTTSTSVPLGAASWDSPISSGTTSFDYVVSVSGTYSYKCTPHGFTGSFIASGSSGIGSTPVQVNFSISVLENAQYTFTYSLSKSATVNLSLCDLTGKMVRKFQSNMKGGGEYSETYSLSDLSSGIYIVQFGVDNQRITRRIIVE
jgi:plastocyanin